VNAEVIEATALPRLGPGALPANAEVPGAGALSAAIGVVHIGPGAFHRAHQAWYFDDVLQTDPRWGICEVALKSPATRDALLPQRGLYTVAVLDADIRYRVIGAVRELLVAPDDLDRVLARMSAPDTRIVTLTITEKGYCLDATGGLDFDHPDIVHDVTHPAAPRSAIGLLVEALRQRRAKQVPAFTTISCDNLVDNGVKLHAAVVALARRRDDALAHWIETAACFPRSMVDSIVPASDDALRSRVAGALGVRDQWPVQREAFKQWVIEDRFCNERPDLAAVGVTLTADVPAFVRAKLRLLNGAHSALAYMGYRAGHRTVAAAMRDDALVTFLRAMMTEDVLPTLSAPPGLDLADYVDTILHRFANPAIRHELAQIAWDGSQKLPFRLFGTIADALAAGRGVARLCVPIAAWLHFIRDAVRDGRTIVDPLAAVLAMLAARCDGSDGDIEVWMELESVFPEGLRRSDAFLDALTAAYRAG
jgi:fructuronate reductase